MKNRWFASIQLAVLVLAVTLVEGYPTAGASLGPTTSATTSPAFAQAAAVPFPPDGTIISSDITTDTTWTKTGSPYTVTAAVSVWPAATLRVEPGVTVAFQQLTGLAVNGKLQAIGAITAPITFTATTPQPGWWTGLGIVGTIGVPISGSALGYVTVDYGGAGGYGDLYAAYATVTVTHGLFRHSSASGIYGDYEAVVNIADSAFVSNTAYAVRFYDGSVDPVLSNLTAAGNGYNGVALGLGTLEGEHVWESSALPYLLLDDEVVPTGASLTIEPGVMVQVQQNKGLTVRGQLAAMGTPSQTITFTGFFSGTAPQPGWWTGISVFGTINQPDASALLDHTTIEYGGHNNGSGSANLYVDYGRAVLTHSVLRYSGADGLYALYDAQGSSIESSQIVSNTGYGVLNTQSQIMLAANNWWGSATGPTADNISGTLSCNPGGTGSRVSLGVEFQPYLTSAGADPGTLPPSAARILTLTPDRWFAPADGANRINVTFTLRDGAGQPLPGRQVSLQTTLGSATSGGVTDPQGQTFAYVTSDTPGDAVLTAVVNDLGLCETARSASSNVTFTPPSAAFDLLPNAQAPYLNDGLEIDPLPIVRGISTTLRARVQNPNAFPITVTGSFGFVQSSIGLAFGPLGGPQTRVIPAGGQGIFEIRWLPVVVGHYCFEFDYALQGAGGPAAGGTLQASSGSGQRNGDTKPGKMISPKGKNAIRKAKIATDGLQDGQFALGVLTDRAGLVSGLVQGQMVGNLLDFIYTTSGAISCGLEGGDQCKGWNGPSWQLPGNTYGNLKQDPPRQDYRTIATLGTITFPPVQPGPDMPVARADALNALTADSLDLSVKLMAAVVSNDRYAGAMEAGDQYWAAVQANAYLYYLKQSGRAMILVADQVETLTQEIRSEGFVDVIVTAADYSAYQDRLRTQGFSAQEINAAHLAGLTDAEIQDILQQRLSLDPNQVAGSMLEAWTNLAAAYRDLGNELIAPPTFPQIPGKLAMPMSTTNSLARVFASTFAIPVGNPLTQTASIELRIRRVDLPLDWVATVTPTLVTLAPGAQITATVTIEPPLSAVQGYEPQVAVEGYVNGNLIGGVALDVPVPKQVPFDGQWRVYLPVVYR